jgi:hypothetical protein
MKFEVLKWMTIIDQRESRLTNPFGLTVRSLKWMKCILERRLVSDSDWKESAAGVGENGRCILFFLEWMNGIFPKAVCGMRTKAVSGELGEGREGIASDVKPLYWSFVACCC